MDSVYELSRFRQVLSKDPVAPGYIQCADNLWTESSSESLNLLMETHFPGCTDIESEPRFGSVSDNLHLSGSDDRDNDTIREMFTGNKVTWAVSTFETYKSPFPDGIFPAMLQNVNDRAISLLVDIFRVS